MKLFWFPIALGAMLFPLAGAPVIDGRLDDPEWRSARKFDRFTVMDSSQPAPGRTAYLLHDDQALYIAFKLPKTPGKKLSAKAERRDGRAHADDSVEIMISPGASQDRYAHIVVNSAGVIADGYCDQGGFGRDDKWNGEITVGTQVGDDGWSVEVKIPYSSLELESLPSDDWSFNFCHNSKSPAVHSSTAAGGAYHRPDGFARAPVKIDRDRYTLQITPPQFGIKRASDGSLAVMMKLKLTNTGHKEQNFKLDAILLGESAAAGTVKCKLAPQSAGTFALPPLEVKKPGTYTAVISILDPVTRTVRIRQKFPLELAFSPLAIELEEPHYGATIFASQNLREVVFTVTAAEETGQALEAGIRDASGKVLFRKVLAQPGSVRVPTAVLPDGRLEIFARSGEFSAVHNLRKLPAFEGEIWRDRQGFWRRDGRRFFPICEWSDRHVPGANVSSRGEGRYILDMSMMYSNFKAKQSYRNAVIDPESEKIFRAAAAAARENPLLAFRYFADEPEIGGVSADGLRHAADIVRDEDPYHPLIVSNDTVAGVRHYAGAGEINGLHPYPSPEKNRKRSNFNRVVAFMDSARSFNASRKDPQSIFYLQQGFNYGDWGNRNSRIPTFDEIRTQFYLSVILGGRGIIFYTRSSEHYPEIGIGAAETGKEFAALEDVLTADDDPAGKNSGKVRTLVKKLNGEIWIFAAYTQDGVHEETFSMPELGNRKLQVWREDRAVAASDGTFRDTFRNFDVHIYTTSADRRNLRSLAEVEAEIARVNAARRKPGNLAFQMQEFDRLQLASSSNFWPQGRADNTLWHVTDGVNLGERSTAFGNNRTYFKDGTPGRAPDWIELKFPEKVAVGRVAVYPVARSLRDYEVQLHLDGAWKTVGKVVDAQGDMQEFKFPAQFSDRVRVWITANRGPHSMIAEIEVYEQ